MISKNKSQMISKNKSQMISKNNQNIKPVKNIFNLIQVKKMIGKKLIIPWKGINKPPQEINYNARKVKKKILESAKNEKFKKIILSAICLNGVLNIINGLDRCMALSMISYKEIQKNNMENMNVIILQYPKMSQKNIKNIIMNLS